MRKPMGEKRREMSKNNRDVVLEAYKAFEHAEPTISRVMTPEDFMFRDVPVYKQARFATRFSDTAVETLRERRAFTDGHLRSEEHTSELQSLMRTSYAVFCL